MKYIFSLLLVILLACENAPSKETPLYIDIIQELVIPKHYIVNKNNGDIIIDGKANEESWQNAPFSESFIDIEGVKKPRFDTKIKILWDNQFLYVYAKMEEPHIWGDITQRDAIIFYNNDFEVFVAPSGATYNYGEIEINALGTIWDLLLDKPYRDGGKAVNYWNLSDLKSAIHIEGTLNDPSDIDSFWTVEMAIPMKALIELKNKPKSIPNAGEQWRINFSRVQWDFELVDNIYQRKKVDGKYLREYNWVWSNQKVINMHEPEKWGIIQFSDEASPESLTFKDDENILMKQVAYALYRQTRRGSLKKLLEEKAGHSKTMSVKYSELDSMIVEFYKTNFGFEYKINVPNSDKVFLINESGTLVIVEK